MKCIQCKADVYPTAKKCPRCGADLVKDRKIMNDLMSGKLGG